MYSTYPETMALRKTTTHMSAG